MQFPPEIKSILPENNFIQAEKIKIPQEKVFIPQEKLKIPQGKIIIPQEKSLFSQEKIITQEEKKIIPQEKKEIFKDPRGILEEQKFQSKPFPRIPSLPKVYEPPLGKIDEELSASSKSSSRELAISVENPILISSGWLGSTSYYQYTIITRSSGKVFQVKRRFSDMDWMHNQLVAKYKGFIIPTRPDKKLIKNTDEKFIEERRLQMEKYLNIIAKHPILCLSQAFTIFTQTATDKLEKEKLKAEACEEYQEYRSIEDTVDKVFAMIQNKFQIILSQKILPFSREMSEIEEKLIKLEAPTQTLSGAFTHWVQGNIEGNKIFIDLKLGSELQSFITEYKSAHRAKSQSLTKFSLEVKEELLRLEGLKEALNSYKNTVKECCELQNLITIKLGKHKSSSDEDTAARYLNEIQSTQDHIDKYNKRLTQIEENVIKESSCFDSAKIDHFDATIKELVTSQKEHYSKEAIFWKKCSEKFRRYD